MATNLGQTFMGGGIMPSLAQELAAGNFHDNRESFHDYIYSKLILGEDKDNTNTPVFPPTGLANYASSMGPPVGIPFSQNSVNASSSVSNNAGSSNTLTSVSSTNSMTNTKTSGSKKSSGTPGSSQPKVPSSQLAGTDQEGSAPKKKKSPKKKEKNNFCDVCGRGFAEKYTLNRHMFTHTHVKPYSCTKCNMAFSRSDGLAKHMAAGHRRIDAHHCDVCGGTFNSEVSYEQHRREYGTTLPFVCNLCMLAFSQCCHLNYHMKSHSLKSDYGLPDDPDSKHEPIDVDDLIPEDFSPPKTSKEPSNKVNSFIYTPLNSTGGLGIQIKHEVEDIPSCGRDKNDEPGSVENASMNNLHNLVPRSSSSPAGSNLTEMGINTSQANIDDPSIPADMKKYFDIKVPNPKFIDPSTLTTAPPGEDGLFRCGICGKGFTRKYHMQRHVRLHTRGPVPRAHLLDWTRRPYACGVCKMGFTRQHHLTRHMLIHTGERPHSCHICGKAFRRFTNLSLHVRTVHGSERPFKCSVCGRGFPRVYSLQRHMKSHNKDSESTLLLNRPPEQATKMIQPPVDPKKAKPSDFESGNIKPQGNNQNRDGISSEESDDEEDYERHREQQSLHEQQQNHQQQAHQQQQQQQQQTSSAVPQRTNREVQDKRNAANEERSTNRKQKNPDRQPQFSSHGEANNMALNRDRVTPLSTISNDHLPSQNLLHHSNHELMQQQQQQQQSLISQSQLTERFPPQALVQSHLGRLDLGLVRGSYPDVNVRGSAPYPHGQQVRGEGSSLNQQAQVNQQTPSDKSSAAFAVNQASNSVDRPVAHNQPSSSIDKSSAQYMLHQAQGNGENFNSQPSRPQSQQMMSSMDRPDSRDRAIYAQLANNFQLPILTPPAGTMDLSSRSRVLREAAAGFGQGLPSGHLGLNEASAFALSQAGNALSVFSSAGYQQHSVGEALSRLDMELQSQAHQSVGQMPPSSHNSRPY